MKNFIFLLFVCCSLKGYADTYKNEELKLKLEYNQLADHFHVIDHLTESVPYFFLISEYKTFWIEQFGELDQSDLILFKEYQALRKKYQNMTFFDDLTSSKVNGLFAPSPQDVPDIVADAFYTSESIEKALDLLDEKLEKHELQLINDVFKNYRNKILKFINFNYEKITAELDYFNRELANPLVDNIFSETINFYQVEPQKFKSVLIFWMPNKSFRGACYGDHLQIKIPVNDLPIDDESTMRFLTSVIVHEAIHHISGSMPSGKKQELSKVFLSTIQSLNSTHFLNAIEEPLVMAHQMRFVKNNYPKIYAENADWFNHPLAKEYLLILEEYIANRKSIDIDFIIKLSESYTKNAMLTP